ncbi:hypothetical protein K439DRAFT_1616408 [Ramaria rubella]|nr:hypothetical protein K439DRAFT_1616408 [Ramaria rubella]
MDKSSHPGDAIPHCSNIDEGLRLIEVDSATGSSIPTHSKMSATVMSNTSATTSVPAKVPFPCLPQIKPLASIILPHIPPGDGNRADLKRNINEVIPPTEQDQERLMKRSCVDLEEFSSLTSTCSLESSSPTKPIDSKMDFTFRPQQSLTKTSPNYNSSEFTQQNGHVFTQEQAPTSRPSKEVIYSIIELTF